MACLKRIQAIEACRGLTLNEISGYKDILMAFSQFLSNAIHAMIGVPHSILRATTSHFNKKVP